MNKRDSIYVGLLSLLEVNKLSITKTAVSQCFNWHFQQPMTVVLVIQAGLNYSLLTNGCYCCYLSEV
ncbi:MAG: hypothetical protein KME32_03785 [Mojavia pulchra JT2-VF2]|uniref:Uncharacterized protein n=1 Tax=Mojavia pulchra JT2-VF2 TaxID=287848 RepID=A0A951PUV3_9NOST|nr:hypothetical protein [Mojavia pulchra JT2-VF2]